ncbi:MAG: hypothetical protein WD801_15745 [Gemmatimonadaceae bacterium]
MDQSRRPVTRGALERVLARASELQGAIGDESETRDTLTEGQVVELGREVGLSPEHIRQALAEERARIAPDTASGSGLAYQLFGANRVTAQRVVRGSPARILDTLDRWMQRDEWMRVIRQRADLIVWEPKRGLLASLRRSFGSRDYALFRANDIAATVVPVDADSTLVRMEADFSVLRESVAKQTVAGTTLGVGTSAALILMNVMVPVAAIPAVLITAGAYAQSRRMQRHATERALLTMQLLLDRVERGDTEPPSLLRMIESALPR